MEDVHQYRAFCAILFAICYLMTVGVIALGFGHDIAAAGLAAAVTGLIGVARLPQNKSVTVDNKSSDPVPVDAS